MTAADMSEVPPHAGQVVRRALLRRGIAVDLETAQAAADVVWALFQAGTAPEPSRGRRRGRRRGHAADGEPLF